MTSLARIVGVMAGIASLLLAGAALVRQAALAADSGMSWRGSAWWAELTERSSTATVIVTAAALAAAVLLAVLAYRQVSPARTPEIIEFAVSDGTARLSVPALRKALRRRFEALLPGSKVTEMAIARTDEGWSVRLEAALPVCDLPDVHRAAYEAFRDDMRRVATIELARLDLIVTRMRARKTS